MKLQNDDGEFTLPIEDITALILESPQITLSSTLLSACQEHGLAVLTCDYTHTPNGILLPFQPHSRQSRVAHIQSTWTDSLKRRLWKAVVQRKIQNQAACLEALIDKKSAKPLYSMAERVKEGDPNNIEAQAARDYWPKLMGKEFRRGRACITNAALNYTYAVLRAYVARSQVAYGLLPTFGIHHNNQLNAFNLTDDLMEVFRPFADKIVWDMRENGEFEENATNLNVENRQSLANIGNILCQIGGQSHSIGNACDKMAFGLVNAIEGKSSALLMLPEFIFESDSL
ncbi:MAG: type II CRISPR-associated endonuclease Cas1 [Alphaproteobacteria bacterium]|nr:type II CRISPR-associated endonuclease Cas1 [Alphaproteobacteria bacterium]